MSDSGEGPASYPVPDPGMAVLMAAQTELQEAQQKVAIARVEEERARSRADAFLSALCAALGVPRGAEVEIDREGKRLIVPALAVAPNGM